MEIPAKPEPPEATSDAMEFQSIAFQRVVRAGTTLAAVGALTLFLTKWFTVNPSTASFIYLIAILLIATTWGLVESLVASVMATLCFDYFFIPPIHTLSIAEAHDWTALLAFLATALVASHLSNLAKRRASEAVRLSEELRVLASIVDSSDDAIISKTLDGVILSWNMGAERLYGYRAEEAVGKSISFLASPDRTDELTNILKALKQGERVSHLETVRITKDGKRIDASLTISPVKNARGEVIGASTIGRDITERKHIEAALRTSEQQFRQLADNIPEVLFILEPNPFRTVYISPAYDEIWGRTREEVYQRPEVWLDSVHPEDRARASTLDLQSKQGVAGVEEYRVVRPDGSIRWIRARTFPVFDSNRKVDRWVGIAQDMTTEKRVHAELQAAKEAAESASIAKSQFLANVSHELRTPMNGIIGLTELTLDTELTLEQRDYLRMVKDSADSLLTIVNKTLDFSKLVAGRLELDSVAFKLDSCIGQTIEAFAPLAHKKRLEFTYEIAPGVPQSLLGDPTRLGEILRNLLGNAIKFTERGEVFLRVQLESKTEKNTLLRFSITDTGIGIAPEMQASIFQAFVQGDGSATRKYGGTGLGLSIASQIVCMMGGTIGVESAVGKGSTFHFTARFGLHEKPAEIASREPTANR